jgi:hypothetical protein
LQQYTDARPFFFVDSMIGLSHSLHREKRTPTDDMAASADHALAARDV